MTFKELYKASQDNPNLYDPLKLSLGKQGFHNLSYAMDEGILYGTSNFDKYGVLYDPFNQTDAIK
jgi:hypothetical protein